MKRMTHTQSPATVVFGFDMETDVGSWTPFYNGVVKGTPKLLRLLEKRRVVSTFFFTGDAARTHPKIVRMVRDAGHEVGNHSLYHDTVGDEILQIPGVKPLLPSEVPLRLRLAEEWIAEALGKRPISFRAPRLWSSTAVVNVLEKMGYVADASYPMFYHRNDRDLWPLFRTEGAAVVLQHLESFARVAEAKGQPLVLCFYFHPWEFFPMPQGPIHYGEGAVVPAPFIVKNCGEVALRQLDLLIEHLRSRFDAQFMSAEQLARGWPVRSLAG